MNGDSFNFYGQTTFLNQPKDVVLRNFQNTIVEGASGDKKEILMELEQLLDLILSSNNMQPSRQEQAANAVHAVAGAVRGEMTTTPLAGTLTTLDSILSSAADIAAPASSLVSHIMIMLGLV